MNYVEKLTSGMRRVSSSTRRAGEEPQPRGRWEALTSESTVYTRPTDDADSQ